MMNPTGRPPALGVENDPSARYRQMIAQALMSSGPRQAAGASDAGAGWMGGLAAALNGIAQGAQMSRGMGGATGSSFSAAKAWDTGFGLSPAAGGMKGAAP